MVTALPEPGVSVMLLPATSVRPLQVCGNVRQFRIPRNGVRDLRQRDHRSISSPRPGQDQGGNIRRILKVAQVQRERHSERSGKRDDLRSRIVRPVV